MDDGRLTIPERNTQLNGELPRLPNPCSDMVVIGRVGTQVGSEGPGVSASAEAGVMVSSCPWDNGFYAAACAGAGFVAEFTPDLRNQHVRLSAPVSESLFVGLEYSPPPQDIFSSSSQIRTRIAAFDTAIVDGQPQGAWSWKASITPSIGQAKYNEKCVGVALTGRSLTNAFAEFRNAAFKMYIEMMLWIESGGTLGSDRAMMHGGSRPDDNNRDPDRTLP